MKKIHELEMAIEEKKSSLKALYAELDSIMNLREDYPECYLAEIIHENTCRGPHLKDDYDGKCTWAFEEEQCSRRGLNKWDMDAHRRYKNRAVTVLNTSLEEMERIIVGNEMTYNKSVGTQMALACFEILLDPANHA